ncbi:MAG TPA: FAD-binding oxidoreductase [Anaerolineales bacterium]|nr:FAD-binding oxidoreductase [Anaerolineales bacterium]
MITNKYSPVTPKDLSYLVQIVGEGNLSRRQSDLDLHAQDQSAHAAHRAEAILWVENVEQVSRVLAYANEQRIPVTAWGAGSSLEGNPIPLCGGILISFEHMNKIVAIHADDFQVTVQPGLGYKDLNTQLARHGLFFAPDPGANASIGGMLANNAAGIRTVKYGATKDNVLRMQVVLADGRVMEAGSRSVKQSSGYDLTHLFIGSEGTLGLITEVTLKLAPIPEHISAAVACCENVGDAIQAVVAIRGSGTEPAALEFLDGFTVGSISESNVLGMLPKPTLFMEFHAMHVGALESVLNSVREICLEAGGLNIKTTTNNAERLKLWHARHHTYETIVRRHAGQKVYISDVAVPISAYPELIAFIEIYRREHNMTAYAFGHAGDGNIHICTPFTDDTYQSVYDMNTEVVKKAISLNGTATGEHGVGIGKARFMKMEHGLALDVMHEIKQTLDPNRILNPGKIFS